MNLAVDIEQRLANMEAEIASLKTNVYGKGQLWASVRRLEKLAETHLETPWWKRIVFALDGWRLYGLQDRPQWRPWRKWYKS